MTLQALRMWSRRQWLVAAGAAELAALVLGLATGSVPNPVTVRVIPTPWWGYPLWGASAMLSGMLAATWAAPRSTNDRARTATLGGVLSVVALGCPVCNKLAVLALGVSGALSWFAPAQPVLAVASLVLLAVALRRRLRGAIACPRRDPA